MTALLVIGVVLAFVGMLAGGITALGALDDAGVWSGIVGVITSAFSIVVMAIALGNL